jgi:hypothetical protein
MDVVSYSAHLSDSQDLELVQEKYFRKLIDQEILLKNFKKALPLTCDIINPEDSERHIH